MFKTTVTRLFFASLIALAAGGGVITGFVGPDSRAAATARAATAPVGA